MPNPRKTYLITGSTDGVGRRVAEQLAAPGTTVLIHGRNLERATSVLQTIADAGGEGYFYNADFSSLSGVRTLADEIARDHSHLDLLINNAGIGVGSNTTKREVSADGFELRFAVNYLSGFLLTHRLLPLLEQAEAARIVNISSAGQQPLDFSDVMLLKRYSGQRAYCQSKLAQIMFTIDLASELEPKGITANCLHPASYMDTAMVRHDGIAPMSTVDEGADAILHLALSDTMARRTGYYYDGLRPARAHSQASDEASRMRLRELSFDLAGLRVST